MSKNAALVAGLEKLVDCETLQAVLLALAEMCQQKAEHVASGYVAHGSPDAALGRCWERAGARIETTAMLASIDAVSR